MSKELLQEIAELGEILECKIQTLKQKVFFVENSYDFHHKEDHKNILKQKVEVLQKTEHVCLSLNEQFYNFEESLIKVNKICEEVDQNIEIVCKKYGIDSKFLAIQKKDDSKESLSEEKENISRDFRRCLKYE